MHRHANSALATFVVGKTKVLQDKVQAANAREWSEAAEMVAEYTRFMTLLARADVDVRELFVAPPRLREVWELHCRDPGDYEADCSAAGLTSSIVPQVEQSHDSPCGATGAKINTVSGGNCTH